MSHTGLLQQVAQQDVPGDHEIQGGLLGAIGQQVVSPEVMHFGLSDADVQPEQPLGLLELITQKKWLISKGHKRVAYFWVREKEKAKGYHYHVVIWLDGNKIQNPRAVQQRWEELHKNSGHSHPWRVKRETPMIQRGKPETQSKAVYVFSYLAKARSKGYCSVAPVISV